MIFNTEVTNFYETESHKERNLYYKVFGGYLFNELLGGYLDRKNAFFEMLIANCDKAGFYFGDNQLAKQRLKLISKSDVTVTFDYHINQGIQIKDRGEMSDVLISSNSAFCSIECKYLSDYDYNNDIKMVQNRINQYAKQHSLVPVQILLITKQKHYKSKQTTKIDTIECPLVFAHWEQIMELTKGTPIERYIEVQLMRKKGKM